MITVHVGEQEFSINPKRLTVAQLAGTNVTLSFTDGSIVEFTFAQPDEARKFLRAIELYVMSKDLLTAMQDGVVRGFHTAQSGNVLRKGDDTEHSRSGRRVTVTNADQSREAKL